MIIVIPLIQLHCPYFESKHDHYPLPLLTTTISTSSIISIIHITIITPSHNVSDNVSNSSLYFFLLLPLPLFFNERSLLDVPICYAHSSLFEMTKLLLLSTFKFEPHYSTSGGLFSKRDTAGVSRVYITIYH